jgi:putative endonuclease
MEAADRIGKGRAGEDLAARFLELEGYEVLSRNVRCADVEVDLLARRGKLLVLVEVKLRRRGLVRAAEGVRQPQRRRLLHAARALLARYVWAEEVRLDVVGVDWNGDGDLRLSHLSGAFYE